MCVSNRRPINDQPDNRRTDQPTGFTIRDVGKHFLMVDVRQSAAAESQDKTAIQVRNCACVRVCVCVCGAKCAK